MIDGRACCGCSGWTRSSPSRRGATGVDSRAHGVRLLAGGANRRRRDGAHGRRVLQRPARLARLRRQRRRVAACHRRGRRTDELVRTTIPAPVTYRGMPAAPVLGVRGRTGRLRRRRRRAAGPRAHAARRVRDHLRQRLVRAADRSRRRARSAGRSRSIVTNTFGERFLIRSSRDAGRALRRMAHVPLSSTRPEFGPISGADPARRLPAAAHAGQHAREPCDRGRPVPARRDGQHGLGRRAHRRKRDRAAAQSLRRGA